jgi:DNA replication protein DnaC
MRGTNMKANIKDFPKDEWQCDVCGSLNTNWIQPYASMHDNAAPIFIKGICPKCEEIHNKNVQIRKDKERIREKKLLIKKLKNQSKIPVLLQDLSFSDLEKREGSEKAFEVLQSKDISNRWIYIWGNNSVGKTYLMAAAFNHFIINEIPCIFINESLFFSRIQQSWDKDNPENQREIYQMIEKAEVIFFDDFMVTDYMNTRWKHDILTTIIETCLTQNKKIIFSSNIDPNNNLRKLEDRIGKRITARFRRNNLLCVEVKCKQFDSGSVEMI